MTNLFVAKHWIFFGFPIKSPNFPLGEGGTFQTSRALNVKRKKSNSIPALRDGQYRGLCKESILGAGQRAKPNKQPNSGQAANRNRKKQENQQKRKSLKLLRWETQWENWSADRWFCCGKCQIVRFWMAEKQFVTEHLKTWRPSSHSLEYLAIHGSGCLSIFGLL